MDILIPDVGVVGLETLDSILEGILDNENSSSLSDCSTNDQDCKPLIRELSPVPTSPISENGPFAPLTIKTESPDSCSVDAMVSRKVRTKSHKGTVTWI